MRQGTDVVLRRYAPGDTQGHRLCRAGARRGWRDAAHAHTDVLYTFSGWMQMPLVYRWDGKTSTDTGCAPTRPWDNLPEVEIVDVEVPSHDGAKGAHDTHLQEGLAAQWQQPDPAQRVRGLWLPDTASFLGGRLAWIEQGGVLALANVRNSGVHGHDWYLAGKKATKSNTWKDSVACRPIPDCARLCLAKTRA